LTRLAVAGPEQINADPNKLYIQKGTGKKYIYACSDKLLFYFFVVVELLPMNIIEKQE